MAEVCAVQDSSINGQQLQIITAKETDPCGYSLNHLVVIKLCLWVRKQCEHMFFMLILTQVSSLHPDGDHTWRPFSSKSRSGRQVFVILQLPN